MKVHLITLRFLAVAASTLILSGCSDNRPTTHQTEQKSVEDVAQIPDEFKEIVEKNSFSGITAFDERLLKSEILSADEQSRTVSHRIRMMDVYGEELAGYSCDADDAYHVTTLTATQDGGFLFVLGFRDYAYSQDAWASDAGFASHVIKCDSLGNLQFDTALDGIEDSSLDYCFEKNGQFYFFGDLQTPETDTRGVHSPTDISMIILDGNGEILCNQCIGGSDFDSLDGAEITDVGFLLSVNAQSQDGDFTGSNSKGYPVNWVITVNDQLEITEKKKETGRDYFDQRIGEKDGVQVYPSSSLLSGFDAGTPEALIDYGDFYLIVSENITGVYENTPPLICSTWYYTETVYSAYDDTGKLLFRTAVDSSPDYDALASRFYTNS